ncbi:MAG: hypothetical protein M1401_19060 [Chloroflexi bacterium]|nr:hypothetical protein [Chloroflexota bacterium]MCL5110920.1 hypothetical protein [Chloroflexota bacterium]
MQFGLGITVTSLDEDEVGEIRWLVVDPAKNALSHVVVADGQGSREGTAVPVWAVSRAEDSLVSLETDAASVVRFPRFGLRRSPGHEAPAVPHEPGDFPFLFPEDGSLPAAAVALAADTEVRCRSQTLGTLAAVFADDYTAEVTTLVVRLKEEDKLVDIPMSWVRDLTRSAIRLDCHPEDVATLPATAWQPAS